MREAYSHKPLCILSPTLSPAENSWLLGILANDEKHTFRFGKTTLIDRFEMSKEGLYVLWVDGDLD